jgi:hypothetical protein
MSKIPDGMVLMVPMVTIVPANVKEAVDKMAWEVVEFDVDYWQELMRVTGWTREMLFAGSVLSAAMGFNAAGSVRDD